MFEFLITAFVCTPDFTQCSGPYQRIAEHASVERCVEDEAMALAEAVRATVDGDFVVLIKCDYTSPGV